MEVTLPSTAKRTRIEDNSNLPITECIREFTLPQQYPSKVSMMKCNNVATKPTCAFKSAKPQSNLTQHVKFVTTNQVPSLQKMQKLRIKAPDGRDLGEISVRLLSQEFKGKTITLMKTSDAQKAKKALGVVSSQFQEKSKSPSNICQDPLTISLKSKQEEIVPLKKIVLGNLSISNHAINTQGSMKNYHNKNKLKMVRRLSKIPIAECTKDCTKVYSERLVPIKKDHSYINTRTSKYDIHSIKLPITYQSAVQHRKIAHSRFPVVKCEKLRVPITPSDKIVNSLQITPVEKEQEVCSSNKLQHSENNMEHCVTMSLEEGKPLENPSSGFRQKNDNVINPCHKKVYVTPNKKNCTILDKNDLIKKKETSQHNIAKLGENNMVMVHANSTSLLEQKEITSKDQNLSSRLIVDKKAFEEFSFTVLSDLNNKKNTAVPIDGISDKSTESRSNEPTFHDEKLECNISAAVCNNKTVEINSVTKSNNNVERDIEKVLLNNKDPTEFPLQRLLDNWSVLEEAVSSVKDKELRTKALKALADCGIGTERRVPILRTEKGKIVHDSTAQTDVFGLWDKEKFILASPDLPNIERINISKQDNYCVTNSVFSNDAVTPPYNFLDNDDLFNLPFQSAIDIPADTENCFHLFCTQNDNASKMKEFLTNSKSNSRSKKIHDQLEKDFNTARQWDANGHMNIHKAVITNRVNDVQRHLMILRACGESVDVLTGDGMTSLELAIQYESSPEIVNTLLKAGAQPVLMQSGHDSALIRACKISSPLLSNLVNYTQNKKLLDYIDSDGSAALHYCARFGNTNGVNILLRNGANVNLRDNRSGRTALFHALEQRDIRMAQLLLDHGAVANIANFAGQIAACFVDDIKNFTCRTSLNKAIQ